MTLNTILGLGLFAAVLAAPAVQAANPVPPLGNGSSAFPIIIRDVEVINELNILFIDMVLDGSAYGMDGEVTVRMLKLANGQYLLSPQWMSPEARELNARMCASQGIHHLTTSGPSSCSKRRCL
ncbi:hypothetical protein [Thauera sp. SDU_THAU2]|uniref:hypothetical protein n=1 Tax=Thauera sp. SDU_THAU2 TaxID=3136633 RepID=UPI00311E556B